MYRDADIEVFWSLRVTKLNLMQPSSSLELRTLTDKCGQSVALLEIQDIPPTHEHLGPGMEMDSGSSNAMEMEPADAEWLLRNAQELTGESIRSDFLRNYSLCPDV
jgi:hypothetical protein